MGSSCSKFNKVFIPPVLGTLVDAKVHILTKYSLFGTLTNIATHSARIKVLKSLDFLCNPPLFLIICFFFLCLCFCVCFSGPGQDCSHYLPQCLDR